MTDLAESKTTPAQVAQGEEARRLAVDAGIRWSRATLVQAERLHRLEDELTPSPHAGRPAVDDTTRERFHQLRTEAHFCVVAARNLIIAVDYLTDVARADLSEEARLPDDVGRRVRLLRNCFEHWTERNMVPRSTSDPAGRSYREFADYFPDDDPNDYVFGAGGTKIGGLSLSAVEEHARRVLEFFLELEVGNFVWKGWAWR